MRFQCLALGADTLGIRGKLPDLIGYFRGWNMEINCILGHSHARSGLLNVNCRSPMPACHVHELPRRLQKCYYINRCSELEGWEVQQHRITTMVTSCSLDSQSGHGGQLSMNGALAVTHAGSEMRHTAADEETRLVVDMLAKRFPYEVDETAVTGNIEALLEVASPRQVVKIISSSSLLLKQDCSEKLRLLVGLFRGFGIQESALRKILSSKILLLDSDATGLRELLEYFERIGVNNLSKMLALNPAILAYKPAEIKARVRDHEELGIVDVMSSMERYPVLVTTSSAHLDQFVKSLGGLIGDTDIGSFIEGSLGLVSREESELANSFNILSQTLGLTEAISLVRRNPNLLAVDSDDASSLLEPLVATFGKESAGRMLAKTGRLLNCKWKKVFEKLEFVTLEMGRPMKEVEEWPQVLCCSKDRRLERRYEALEEKPLEGYQLKSIFGCSDAVFERRFSVVISEQR